MYLLSAGKRATRPHLLTQQRQGGKFRDGWDHARQDNSPCRVHFLLGQPTQATLRLLHVCFVSLRVRM